MRLRAAAVRDRQEDAMQERRAEHSIDPVCVNVCARVCVRACVCAPVEFPSGAVGAIRSDEILIPLGILHESDR